MIGVPDELLGEAIKAFIVLDNKAITENDVRKLCQTRLENFMMPKYIEFVESLPKTDSGKIMRKPLRGAINTQSPAQEKTGDDQQ